jgi:hypothetical protein
MATATKTDWKLSGTVLVACNCDYGCPCNVNAPPTQGNCEGQWLWHVEHGSFGDVSLDGLSWQIACDWPGAIHEGGGKAQCVYDERADEAQRAAIAALARGEQGGPWAIFINTYTLDDPRPAAFDVHVDGLATTASITDALELEFDPIRNPVTGEEIHPVLMMPEGLICKEMAFGTSRTFRVEGNVHYDHSGKYTALAPFEYASA